MPILSTHTLDSLNGTHAAGVGVTLSVILENNSTHEMWSTKTDNKGRLIKEFEVPKLYLENDFQLLFGIKNYFRNSENTFRASAMAININFPEPDGKYHLPVIISPYGASLWWSNKA